MLWVCNDWLINVQLCSEDFYRCFYFYRKLLFILWQYYSYTHICICVCTWCICMHVCIVHSGYSHPHPSLPPFQPHSSYIKSFSHSNLFVLSCDPMSLTRNFCMIMSFELSVRSWEVCLWVHKLKKMTSFPQESTSSQQFSRFGYNPMRPPVVYDWLIKDSFLYRPKGGNHNYYEFMISMAVSSPEGSIL